MTEEKTNAPNTDQNAAAPQEKTPRVVFWGVMAAAAALDQLSKLIVFWLVDMTDAAGPAVIPGFFYITPRLNPGMAWSIFRDLGAAQPAILALLNAVIVTIIVLFREKWSIVFRGRRLYDLAIGLVLAGAVGNLIDRIHPPFKVMDFLHFRFGSWSYPIFNIADIYIVIGVVLFMYWGWFVEKPEAQRAKKPGTE